MLKVQHCNHFLGKNQIIKAILVLPPTFCMQSYIHVAMRWGSGTIISVFTGHYV